METAASSSFRSANEGNKDINRRLFELTKVCNLEIDEHLFR
jgi:hypothetical protein